MNGETFIMILATIVVVLGAYWIYEEKRQTN